jgi:Domain of unknown function (DUF4166)
MSTTNTSMAAITPSPVPGWFGSKFVNLHPLLQALHLQGGQLEGEVYITYGRGLAGWLGRRLASKLGLPSGVAQTRLQVNIAHHDGVLHWDRRFGMVEGADHWMCSRFEPVGHWPDGYWLERTGALNIELGVDVVNGAWHWKPRAFKLFGMPLPAAFMISSHASKRVEVGHYVFEVHMSAPVLGMLLQYCGSLAPKVNS